MKEVAGVSNEPFEVLTVDVESSTGAVMEALGARRATCST